MVCINYHKYSFSINECPAIIFIGNLLSDPGAIILAQFIKVTLRFIFIRIFKRVWVNGVMDKWLNPTAGRKWC